MTAKTVSARAGSRASAPTHRGDRFRRSSAASIASTGVRHAPLAHLQRAAGNRAVHRLMRSSAPAMSTSPGGFLRSPKRISRAASVRCTAGTHGAPANAAALIDAIEIVSGLAIMSAGSSLSMLKLDIILPGVGAGGGYTMPTTQRVTDYQSSWGLPSRVPGTTRFKDRLGGGTYASQAEALYNEVDGVQARYTRLSDRLLGNVLRYRCIGGPTKVSGCTGHCTNRDATGCFFTDLIMVCPRFWGLSMDQSAILLVHEAAHRVFGVDHGRNFAHANCYATYAAASHGQTWRGGPTCKP